MNLDVVVVGAGLAGLVTAWQAAVAGRRVRVVSKGWGATHWGSGCIGVMGKDSEHEIVDTPLVGIGRILDRFPDHPYRLASADDITGALSALKDLCAGAGYPLLGQLEKNWLLPSAMGTVRPVCLAPETMIAGDMHSREPMLIVGFDACLDFFPELAADNLDAQGWPARAVVLDVEELERRKIRTSGVVAKLFEEPDFVDQVVQQLKPQLGDARRVGFPALLGQERAVEVKKRLEALLGRPVFEIPILPPSVPGIRLQRILVRAIERHGGEVFTGMDAVAAETDGRRIISVSTQAAARTKRHVAGEFVLATGGILGGGIVTEYENTIREVVFGLPVTAPKERGEWFRPQFLDEAGHPIFRAGVEVDAEFRPLRDGAMCFENLRVVGSSLAGFDGVRERSMEGVALVSGFQVGRLLGRGKDD